MKNNIIQFQPMPRPAKTSNEEYATEVLLLLSGDDEQDDEMRALIRRCGGRQ